MAQLTVVICTHNRSALLTRTLQSLYRAQIPAGGVQVLVVANHCSDDTHQVLEAQTRLTPPGVQLRWFAEPTKGKSHALNAAMRVIDTPLVSFVDDDQRADHLFLQSTCDAAAQWPDADLLCGKLIPDWDGSEPAWVHETGPYRIYPLPVPNFDLGEAAQWLTPDIGIPSGGNLIVRSHWLQRVGEFSTALGPVGHDLGGSEDSEWVLRALGLGARLLYAPGVVQRHHIDPERLQLGFLLQLTYKRTASTIGLLNQAPLPARVPVWAWRKLLGYVVRSITALSAQRRRFYLMRSAAALGEIAGYRQAAKRPDVRPLQPGGSA